MFEFYSEPSDEAVSLPALKVHRSGRYLMTEDGEPFFYLADTAWELFSSLTREEVKYYFSVRASQGFNVVQATMLGTAGLTVRNKYYRSPLKMDENDEYDLELIDDEPDYSWWDHIDYCVECAAEYGIYLALLPLWNSQYSDASTTIVTDIEKASNYGAFLARRYSASTNIIWMLGGDALVNDVNRPVIAELYKALRDDIHLITFHPCGATTSFEQLKGVIEPDFHTCQSGHALDSNRSHELVRRLAGLGKPFLDSEPHYEDHVADWEQDYMTWDAAALRQSAYSSLLEGACGNTYGNPYIAFFVFGPVKAGYCPFYFGPEPKSDWMDALRHEGAEQVKHYKALRLSRPYFELRPAPELVLNSEDELTFGHISAARGDMYAYIYTPLGQPIKCDLSSLKASGIKAVKASWFDPRTGVEQPECMLLPEKALFVPHSHGRGCDMVLILDFLK